MTWLLELVVMASFIWVWMKILDYAYRLGVDYFGDGKES